LRSFLGNLAFDFRLHLGELRKTIFPDIEVFPDSLALPAANFFKLLNAALLIQ